MILFPGSLPFTLRITPATKILGSATDHITLRLLSYRLGQYLTEAGSLEAGAGSWMKAAALGFPHSQLRARFSFQVSIPAYVLSPLLETHSWPLNAYPSV